MKIEPSWTDYTGFFSFSTVIFPDARYALKKDCDQVERWRVIADARVKELCAPVALPKIRPDVVAECDKDGNVTKPWGPRWRS